MSGCAVLPEARGLGIQKLSLAHRLQHLRLHHFSQVQMLATGASISAHNAASLCFVMEDVFVRWRLVK